MLWTRVRRVCLAPLLAAVLVSTTAAGCDDSNADPSPLPTKSTSSTPTPTPTPTDEPSPPELPDEAKGTSAAAAKAFARHYIDTVNYAARTGDVEGLRQLGTGNCQSCEAIAHNIERVYVKGGRIESDGWTLDIATLVPQQPESRPILDLGITRSAQRIYVQPDAAPKRFDGGKQPMTMYLAASENGAWRVERIDVVS